MRVAFAVLIVAALLSGGCRKPKQQAQATGPAPGGAAGVAGVDVPPPPPARGGGGRDMGGGGGGGVMAVRRAVDREKAGNDLKELGSFYRQYTDLNGRPPADMQQFLGFMQRDSAKLAQALQDGWYVVYWNLNPDKLPNGASNTVLAHEKEMPTGGGMAVMADGTVRRMTPQEFADAKPAQ